MYDPDFKDELTFYNRFKTISKLYLLHIDYLKINNIKYEDPLYKITKLSCSHNLNCISRNDSFVSLNVLKPIIIKHGSIIKSDNQNVYLLYKHWKNKWRENLIRLSKCEAIHSYEYIKKHDTINHFFIARSLSMSGKIRDAVSPFVLGKYSFKINKTFNDFFVYIENASLLLMENDLDGLDELENNFYIQPSDDKIFLGNFGGRFVKLYLTLNSTEANSHLALEEKI